MVRLAHIDVLDLTISACKRFGADRAEEVFSEIKSGIENSFSDKKIMQGVRLKTGLLIGQADIDFVRRVVKAENHIAEAIAILREAAHDK